MEDGKWIDGIKSCTKFFIEEKELDVKLGTELAKFIFKNPTMLNRYQVEWMDAETLTAWYEKVLKLQKLEHTLKVSNMTKYGQGEVDYRNSVEENPCVNCRWFIVGDPKNPEGPGTCQIVSDEIQPNGGCKEFERNPALGDEEEEPKEEEPEEEEPVMEEPPMMEAEQTEAVPSKPVIDVQAAERETREQNLIIERAVLVKELNRIPKRYHKAHRRFYQNIKNQNNHRIQEIDAELKKNKIYS